MDGHTYDRYSVTRPNSPVLAHLPILPCRSPHADFPTHAATRGEQSGNQQLVEKEPKVAQDQRTSALEAAAAESRAQEYHHRLARTPPPPQRLNSASTTSTCVLRTRTHVQARASAFTGNAYTHNKNVV
jgi:hypothetical protein